MIDLLELLNTNVLSLDEAYDLVDKVVEEVYLGQRDPDWATALGFSKYETKAYAHTAGLEDLVRFRYQGWPTVCAHCGLPIDYKVDHWMFRRDEKEQPILVHIHCLLDWKPYESEPV